jgi:hypothetical protein
LQFFNRLTHSLWIAAVLFLAWNAGAGYRPDIDMCRLLALVWPVRRD